MNQRDFALGLLSSSCNQKKTSWPPSLIVMLLEEKLRLPDLSALLIYLCCFGSPADGGSEEPSDRRQASIDYCQSHSGQGK